MDSNRIKKQVCKAKMSIMMLFLYSGNDIVVD